MFRSVLFPLLLLFFNPGSREAASVVFHFRDFLTNSRTAYNSIDLQEKLKPAAPFQGRKSFCLYGSASKYTVIIKQNKVLIISGKIKISGTFKGKKLVTDDPGEIEYRKFAGRYNYGKYYVIGADYFSVLNPENGEYTYYTLCK